MTSSSLGAIPFVGDAIVGFQGSGEGPSGEGPSGEGPSGEGPSGEGPSDEAPVDLEAEGEALANVGSRGEALMQVTPSRHGHRHRYRRT
jgi:hypothetical protein